ncbi:MAG: hypothetical protein LBS23_00330 [Holosporaceae bacterium]|jgi:hypothetical protein|nr:hypothetical protein [Holosporaceae bacterium]
MGPLVGHGKLLRICINLPPRLRRKELKLEIPLIHVLNNKQRVLPKLNGVALPEIALSCPTDIAISVNKQDSSTGKIDLLLELPDAIAPKDLFPDNPDSRLLAIGFKNVIVREKGLNDIHKTLISKNKL